MSQTPLKPDSASQPSGRTPEHCGPMELNSELTNNAAAWRRKLFEIIYHADTPAGKWFDIILILSILSSVLVIMLDTVAALNLRFGPIFHYLEWIFTGLFTLEYAVRVVCIRRPLRYIRSFYGIVDLLAILPTYLAAVLSGGQYLLVVRSLRILRIFRILKLTHYVGEADLLMRALLGAKHKVTVFLFFMLTVVSIFGSFMYLIEGPENGFTSIPAGVYWAIVTVTTVGYGDIAPHTPLGQALASVMVIIGYSIIAVPTGIFTAELSTQIRKEMTLMSPPCQVCDHRSLDSNAVYCSQCGAEFEKRTTEHSSSTDEKPAA